MQYFDPKIDVVFKKIFSEHKNKEIAVPAQQKYLFVK